MTGTSTGAKNNSYPKLLIKLGYFRIKESTTFATFTKSVEKISFPKMLKNLSERWKNKAKINRQHLTATCL